MLNSHPPGPSLKLSVTDRLNSSRLELSISFLRNVDAFGVNSRISKRSGVAHQAFP
jgi:hypothetical protein